MGDATEPRPALAADRPRPTRGRQARRRRVDTTGAEPARSSRPRFTWKPPPAAATEPLPFRAILERAFGCSLDDVETLTGLGSEVTSLGASGLSSGDLVAFAAAHPTLYQVAHELAHVLQTRRAGRVPSAPHIAPGASVAEAEATAAAASVAAGRTPAPIRAAPAGAVQLQGTEEDPLDKTADADAVYKATHVVEEADDSVFDFLVGTVATVTKGLTRATARHLVLQVLERNQDPEHMAALVRTYAERYNGASLPVDVRTAFSADDADGQWARARTFLGEQLPLHEQIATRRKNDLEGVTRDLEHISDKRALDLFSGGGTRMTWPPVKAPEAAATTIEEIKIALRDRLENDKYYEAMRLLLAKADRALAAECSLKLNEVMKQARIDLAVERIESTSLAGGYLALTDLDKAQREELAKRLEESPIEDREADVGALIELAREPDDATVIQRAINQLYEEAFQDYTLEPAEAIKGIGLDVAIERGGEVMGRARSRLEELPQDAPEAERQAAAAEVDRLERLFFDEYESMVPSVLRSETTHGESVENLVDKFRRIGASPLRLATERASNAKNFDELRAALDAIDKPEHREHVLAYVVPGLIDDWSMDDVELSDEQLAVLEAYGGKGEKPAHEIAMYALLADMKEGAKKAHVVLARLSRLPDEQRKAVFADSRYQAAVAALPDNTEGNDFRDALARAEASSASIAMHAYPGPAGAWQDVILEYIRTQVELPDVGQAKLRRGAVLKARLAEDPTLDEHLTPEDQSAIAWLDSLQRWKVLIDKNRHEIADEIMFGGPQLVDAEDDVLDAGIEAEYMRRRIRTAADIPYDVSVIDTELFTADLAEALTAFDVLFTRAQPGGVSSGELALLAEQYYVTMRAIEKEKIAIQDNESSASSIAMLVGTIVAAVVVTIASFGTLTPLAVAAVAAVAAGTAAMLAGAAVRWKDTPESMLKDFGTGAVEGALAVAGSMLAAKIVYGTTKGLQAGRAAATAGSTAAQKATGTAGQKIAEIMIDGAVGGAGGELFQTAIDAATWDRGIGEAFAKMLAAIARGAATGAVGGAVVGGVFTAGGKLLSVASRHGDDVARNVGRVLESSGVGTKVLDDLDEVGKEKLAKAVQSLEDGDVDSAVKVLRSVDGLPRKARELLAAAAKARAALVVRKGPGTVVLDGDSYWPRIVSNKEFKALGGDPRADAMVVIRDGKPQIVARHNARPSSIREEVIHLHQWQTDISLRLRMERLSEKTMEGYHALDQNVQLQLHVDKLVVEADAQRRIVDQLAGQVDDPDAGLRVLDAQETLFLINQRIAKLERAQADAAAGRHVQWDDLKLEELPRLYSKVTHTTTKQTKLHPRLTALAKRPGGLDVRKPNAALLQALDDLGYVPHWRNDKIFRVSRKPGHQKLAHLTINEHGKLEVAPERLSFEEQKEAAAIAWTQSQKQLDAYWKTLRGGTLTADERKIVRVAIKQHSPRFRAKLEKRIAQGKLDKGSAGLLSKWGPVAELIESTSQDMRTIDRWLDELLDAVPAGQKSLRPTDVDEFRRIVRNRTAEFIASIKGKERVEVLGKALDLMDDPASQGHLFRAFRTTLMGTAEYSPLYKVVAGEPKPFTGKGLGTTKRTPDGVADVTAKVRGLPPGRYAIEDKAGKGAFKLDQAEAYAKRSDPKLPRRTPGTTGDATGGFKLSPKSKTSEYDGVLYAFSSKTEAEAAIAMMRGSKLTRPLLGKHPGGINAIFLDSDGALKVLKLDSVLPQGKLK